jgi:aminoglycoside phosphotransferase (APT) family kinase protein
MRTPPSEPSTATLVAAVERSWGIRLGPPVHQPLGFGSHHWLADGDGTRWWITVDDLASHQASATTSLDDAFAELAASMATARALGDAGCRFVVAPIRTTSGEPIARLGECQAVVVHPHVDGRTHEWGDEVPVEQREAVVDVLVELHAVALEQVPEARLLGNGFDHRDGLERALGDGDRAREGDGPYAGPAARLVAQQRAGLAMALARFDRLLARGMTDPARLVLTHGEPHPGNVIELDGRPVLIDWDTTRVALPERDLATLVTGDAYPPLGGDGSFDAVARYEDASGRRVEPALLEAHALRWDLADVAVYLHQFRAPHTGTADDDQAWANLQRSVERLGAAGP